MLWRQFGGDYAAAVEYLEDRFSKYLTEGTGEAQPKRAYPYFPFIFGGAFPALGVSELASEGEHQHGQTPLPEYADVGIRVYHPSLTVAGSQWKDGRHAARDRCRRVFSAWRQELYADRELRAKVTDLSLGRMEAGDHDRTGSPYAEAGSERTILWVASAVVRVTF